MLTHIPLTSNRAHRHILTHLTSNHAHQGIQSDRDHQNKGAIGRFGFNQTARHIT